MVGALPRMTKTPMAMMDGVVIVVIKAIVIVTITITRMAGVVLAKDGVVVVVVKVVIITINHVEVELDEAAVIIAGEANLTQPPHHGVVPPAATVEAAEDHVTDEAVVEVEAEAPHGGVAVMRSSTITVVDGEVIVVVTIVITEIDPHVGLAEAVEAEEAIMKVDLALAEDSRSRPEINHGVVVSSTEVALIGKVRKV